jgi:hypothetical protein
MTDDDEAFKNTVADQFSEMERTLGREGYESNIKAQNAQTANVLSNVRHNNALTLLLDTKARQHDAMVDLIIGLSRLLVLGAIPVIVMFWVYLFKLWVL